MTYLRTCRLLTDAEFRLGRRNVEEITNHPFFHGVDWHTLTQREFMDLIRF